MLNNFNKKKKNCSMDVGLPTVSEIRQQRASINLTVTATHTRDDVASIFKVD